MIDTTQDIHSMTTFKRNSTDLMKRMKKSGRPLVLTVNGKAEAVVLDAASTGTWPTISMPWRVSGAASRKRRRVWGTPPPTSLTTWNAKHNATTE